MDFDLTEDLQDIRRLARDFAETEVKPTVDADDKAHRFRPDLVKKMGELGFFGCAVPEEYGGNGMGFAALAILAEETARVWSSLRLAFAANLLGTCNDHPALRQRGIKEEIRSAAGQCGCVRLFCLNGAKCRFRRGRHENQGHS